MRRVICKKEQCSGCLACVVACIDEHYEVWEEDACSGRIYERQKSGKTDMQCYKTRSCLHCEEPSCAKACPTDALYRDNNGFVRTAREKCIGCHACEKSCPHDIPRFDKENKIVKCDGCADRFAQGLEPACIRICPTGALRLEMDEINRSPSSSHRDR